MWATFLMHCATYVGRLPVFLYVTPIDASDIIVTCQKTGRDGRGLKDEVGGCKDSSSPRTQINAHHLVLCKKYCIKRLSRDKHVYFCITVKDSNQEFNLFSHRFAHGIQWLCVQQLYIFIKLINQRDFKMASLSLDML